MYEPGSTRVSDLDSRPGLEAALQLGGARPRATSPHRGGERGGCRLFQSPTNLAFRFRILSTLGPGAVPLGFIVCPGLFVSGVVPGNISRHIRFRHTLRVGSRTETTNLGFRARNLSTSHAEVVDVGFEMCSGPQGFRTSTWNHEPSYSIPTHAPGWKSN